MSDVLATALVSTYASERYLQGCLDDLLQQSIGERLEIVVVDACSPEREGELVRAYQQRHGNIRYLRTETREASSLAFERGTAMARGRYLTTANTDDRHHPEFFARMTAVLEQHPEFGLVYADSRITHRDNETWAHNTATRKYAWPDYTPTTALSCCLFGAQPVWRRDVHAVVGGWDPACRYANDQDMFLRIAARLGAVHLREDLGLFLMRKDSVSGSDNRAATLADVMAVMRRYRTGWSLEQVFPALRDDGSPAARAAAWFELGNLGALGPYTDAQWALECYQRGGAERLVGAAAQAMRRAFANNTGCVLACAGADAAADRALALAGDGEPAAANRLHVAARRATGVVPQLRELQFVELPHPVVTASRQARGVTLDAAGRTHWSAPHEQVPWQTFEGPNGVPLAPERTWSLPAAAPAAPAAATSHVLMVMYGWEDSGGGTMLPRAFAHELAARGTRVSVVYAGARPDPELPPYGVRRHREGEVALFGIHNRPTEFLDALHPEREVDDPAVRERFAGLLDELRPDVVHFWNLHNLGMSLPGECRARGIPTLSSSNNYWALCPRLYLFDERLRLCGGGSADGSLCAACVGAPGAAAAYAERRRAGQRMLREDIDVHLAVSQRVRDLYVQNGDDPHHVRVLRQEPPQVAAIWRRTGSRRAIAAELQRPLRIGFFGSVLPHKGVHVLVQALQLLPERAAACVVLGAAAAGYLAHLRQLDQGRRVHFHGGYPQEALPELLAAFDVVVVPSVWDDCAPYVVAEALAARCPVIGSDAGGIPDFVEHGRNGWLFPVGDAAALAERLRSFAADRHLLGRMQQAISAPRGLPAFVQDVAAVYEEVRRVGALRVAATA